MCKLQKSIRLFLIRRFFIYAIMNYQWTMIEKKLFSKKVVRFQEENDNVYKPIVLIEVRKLYFRTIIRLQRRSYMEDTINI